MSERLRIINFVVGDECVITEGPLFEKLMSISSGKWMTIRLPVARPLSMVGDQMMPLIGCEEWEPTITQDGRTGWVRR